MNKFDPDALMKAQVERMKRAQAAAEAELRSAGRASDRNWRAEEAARGVLTQENPAALPFAILAEARRARELAEIAIGKESLADPEPAPQAGASSVDDLPMFSSASDRLSVRVLARKAVHGKKATQECLSSVAISMKFAGMVSVTRRGTPSMLL
jgi:hypothetical protein